MLLSNTLSCYITQHFFLVISLAKGQNSSSQETSLPIERAMKLPHPTTSGTIHISILETFQTSRHAAILKEAAFPLCNHCTATHEARVLSSQRCRIPCTNPVPPVTHLRRHRYEVPLSTGSHLRIGN